MESAAAAEAKLQKPEYQEVELKTGEEKESNVIQVSCYFETLFLKHILDPVVLFHYFFITVVYTHACYLIIVADITLAPGLLGPGNIQRVISEDTLKYLIYICYFSVEC